MRQPFADRSAKPYGLLLWQFFQLDDLRCMFLADSEPHAVSRGNPGLV